MKRDQRTGSAASSSPGESGRIRAGRANPPPASSRPRSTSPRVEEVDAAVAAAARGLPGLAARRRCRARAEVMFRFRELVDAHRTELAAIAHRRARQGARPTPMGEVARGLENIEFACGIPHLLKGGFTEQASTGVDVYSIRQPLGVVAGITPFNFPAMVPMWMFANAIACGNTFVLKPSEKDPSASLFIAELLAEAGLPDGVLQRRAGRQGRGRPPPRAPRHRRGQLRRLDADRPVTSTRPARAHGKRVQALGGAKNHMVVLPDADIDMAADAAVSRRATARPASGAWPSRSWSRSATSATRWSTPIADRIAQLIRSAPAPTPTSEMGPLITARAPRPGRRLPRRRRRRRARRVVVDGRDAPTSTATASSSASRCSTTSRPDMPRLHRRDLRPGARRSCGPTPTTRRVRLVNDNPYGNGTAIFTRDGGAARQFQFDVERRHGRRQRAHPGARSPTTASAAGRRSLFGDTHMYGPEGIHFYTRAKVVTRRWPDPATSAVDLGFPDPLNRLTERPPWTSASSCRPTRRRGGSSTWRSQAERSASATCWTFDSHLLWQEPFVIYSQILADDPQGDRRADGHQPGAPATGPSPRRCSPPSTRCSATARSAASAAATRRCASPTASPDHPGHAARVDRRDPRARQRPRGRRTRAASCASRGARSSRLEVWVAAYGPKALALTGEVGDGFILQLADPDIAAWTHQGGARGGRGGRPRPGRR